MSVQSRLGRLEEVTGFNPAVARAVRSLVEKKRDRDDCLYCTAKAYAMAATEEWERANGLYVNPPLEDTRLQVCHVCGREWVSDVRGYSADEHELFQQLDDLAESIIARGGQPSEDKNYMRLYVKGDAAVRRRGIALWGAKNHWERGDVYRAAFKEFTGVDPLEWYEKGDYAK